MTAKIATYSSESGEGLLILENNEKMNFSINNWSSFDILPSIGLVVEVKENGDIFFKKNNHTNRGSDLIKEKTDLRTLLIKKKDTYLNNAIAEGWKVSSNNSEGFVLIFPNSFSASKFIGWSLGLGLIFGLIFGGYGLLIAIILAIVIALPKNKATLKGAINYKKSVVIITKNDKEYALLNAFDDKKVNSNNIKGTINTSEEAISILRKKGYITTKEVNFWKIKEPLGGTSKIKTLVELIEYANSRQYHN